jgi:hypothetical protein
MLFPGLQNTIDRVAAVSSSWKRKSKSFSLSAVGVGLISWFAGLFSSSQAKGKKQESDRKATGKDAKDGSQEADQRTPVELYEQLIQNTTQYLMDEALVRHG